MSLTAKLELKLNATLLGTVSNLTPSQLPVAVDDVEDFVDGSGAGKAQIMFADTRSLGAGASEDLDMAGSLKDAFGRTLTFTYIKAIYIKAADANTNNVLMGGAPSNALANWVADISDKVVIKPGGAMMIIDPGNGYGVTPSTADLLRVANSGGGTAVGYDIVIIGEGTAV